MKTLALAAAIAAALSTSAGASDALVATVTTVDAKHNALVMGDKTVMLIGKDVDISAIKPGMKVAIAARIDEDGYSPATAVTPTN